jgi:hypothetical protein
MLAKLFGEPSNTATANPTMRGYHVVYREKEVNHCPGCGRSHWYVGRVSAECCFCATALPLIEATSRGGGSWTQPPRRHEFRDAA